LQASFCPHDALTMSFLDENGRLAIEAASTPQFPDLGRRDAAAIPENVVVADLVTVRLPADEANVTERAVKAGYRRVPSGQ
jgi:hypothetical protein